VGSIPTQAAPTFSQVTTYFRAADWLRVVATRRTLWGAHGHHQSVRDRHATTPATTSQQILFMVDSMDVVTIARHRRHDGPSCSPRRRRPADVPEPHDDGEKRKSSRGSGLLLKTVGGGLRKICLCHGAGGSGQSVTDHRIQVPQQWVILPSAIR
jgi:hypothetical protein